MFFLYFHLNNRLKPKITTMRNDHLGKYLNDFESLIDTPFMSLDKIEWWLLKHSDAQKQIIAYQESKYTSFEHEDGSISRFPPLKEVLTESELKFLNLYSELETISEFHRSESSFEKELHIYREIKHSPSDVKDWVAKHEVLATQDYAYFLVDYLDYDVNAKHLNVNIYRIKEFELYIDHEDFKYTVEFLTLFNDLFYTQHVLPESIAKIRAEMDSLPFYDEELDEE